MPENIFDPKEDPKGTRGIKRRRKILDNLGADVQKLDDIFNP